jgi:CBS domain-containing protein
MMFKYHTRHVPVFDNQLVPTNLEPSFKAGSFTRGLPIDGFIGVVDISDVVFAYAEKISKSPGRSFCDQVTVQGILDLKLDDADPWDVYSMCDSSVQQLALKMQREYNLGCQLIRSEANDILGFVSESDIVRKVVAECKDPAQVQAVDIMEEAPVRGVLAPEMGLEAVLDKMQGAGWASEDTGWKYFPVQSSPRSFEGVITLRDVVKQLKRDKNLLTKATDAAVYGSGLGYSYPWSMPESEALDLQEDQDEEVESLDDQEHEHDAIRKPKRSFSRFAFWR